ncbi:hypothetical protein Tco_0267066 [Tanacetum coccineum]
MVSLDDATQTSYKLVWFLENVRNRFGQPKYEDPQGALSKLLQTGTIAQYQSEFEKLMNRVTDVSESLHISFYISGLELTLQRELLVSKPTTLGEAFSLARVTEARLEDQWPTTATDKTHDITIGRQERLSKGLCFNCDSKWMRGHKCAGKILLLMAKEGDNLGRKIPADPAYYLESFWIEADLVDSVTIGIPSLMGDDFTKETIRVEYEWRSPMCDECKIFGHVHDHCPKKMVSPPIVTTSNVIAPTVEKSNDSFQTMGKNNKRKGKSKSSNGGQSTGPSVKQTVRYEPKATTSATKKGATNVSNPSKSSSMLKTADTSPKNDNFTTSNSFSALNDEEVDDE